MMGLADDRRRKTRGGEVRRHGETRPGSPCGPVVLGRGAVLGGSLAKAGARRIRSRVENPLAADDCPSGPVDIPSSRRNLEEVLSCYVQSRRSCVKRPIMPAVVD